MTPRRTRTGKKAARPAAKAARSTTNAVRPTNATPRARRGWRATLLLAVVSPLVFFGLFEAAVRVAAPDLSLPQSEQHFRFTQSFEFELPHHVRDPVLGWRLKPGTYGSMRINSEGFRGPELAPASADGGVRIAHLGDSCTMGFTVADDRQTYPAVLELLLSKSGVTARAYNFGVDGYSSHQGRLLLDQALVLQPDYVTMYFGYNDHHYSNASDRNTRFSMPWHRNVLEKSHAYRFLRRHLLRVMRREARLVQPERRVAPDEFEENLRDMVARVRAAGATPILMTTPLRPFIPLTENEVPIEVDGEQRWVTQEWWVSQQLERRGVALESASGTQALQEVLTEGLRAHPEWPYLHYLQARELEHAGRTEESRAALARAGERDAERRVMEEYAERVRTIAHDEGVTLVDLEPVFARRRERLFNDVVHPSTLGHHVIARRLAEVILQAESSDANEASSSP